MCNNTNSNVTRNTKKEMSHSHACSRKPHKKRQKLKQAARSQLHSYLPSPHATPLREQSQPVNDSSVRLALSTIREAGLRVQPTGLPSPHRLDRQPRERPPQMQCFDQAAGVELQVASSPPGNTALPTTAAGSLGAGWSTRSVLLAPLYAQQALRFSNVPRGPGGGTGGVVGGTLGERAALRGGERPEK